MAKGNIKLHWDELRHREAQGGHGETHTTLMDDAQKVMRDVGTHGQHS